MKTLHNATVPEIMAAFIQINMNRYFQGNSTLEQPNYIGYREQLAQKVVDAIAPMLTEVIRLHDPEARASFFTGFEAGMEVMRILNEGGADESSGLPPRV